jgi:hypothetical protein
VNFLEQPPSTQWVGLKFRGEKFADVWFKPEGEPFALTIRIPQASFHLEGIGPLLTAENLVKAIGVPLETVDSWHRGDGDATNSELASPLKPPQEATHLEVIVRMKPPAPAAGPTDNAVFTPEKWRDFQARWTAILGMEATIDSMRKNLESLRVEMEGALKKSLNTEEKLHALRTDVALWNKAKTRVHHVLPKGLEFIHRATWAMGLPERKALEEFYEKHIQPQVPFPQPEKVMQQLDRLLKERQVLSAHGVTVHEECKSTNSDIQGALRTLQNNAVANAYKKRGASRTKGKHF